MKVLVIGHASYDISVPVESYPIENTKHRFENVIKCGGGPAANAAHLLGKWNIPTHFAGVVGNDTFGKSIIEEMKSVNINTDYLETNYENDTTLSFILINQSNGSRTVFNCANQYMKLKKKDFSIVPDIILIDGHDYMASKKALEMFPNAISIIDAGRVTDELLRLCKLCKHIVCSKGFAETVTKTKMDFNDNSTLAKVYTDLKLRFNGEVAITLEEKGVLYAVDNQIKVLPGIKVETVDSTGAGDIFHGAFTYGIASNYSYEDSLKIANVTAGLSVTKIGAKLSIPTLTEFFEFSKSLGLDFKPQPKEAPVPNPSQEENKQQIAQTPPLQTEQNKPQIPPAPNIPPVTPNTNKQSIIIPPINTKE